MVFTEEDVRVIDLLSTQLQPTVAEQHTNRAQVAAFLQEAEGPGADRRGRIRQQPDRREI